MFGRSNRGDTPEGLILGIAKHPHFVEPNSLEYDYTSRIDQAHSIPKQNETHARARCAAENTPTNDIRGSDWDSDELYQYRFPKCDADQSDRDEAVIVGPRCRSGWPRC